MLQYSPRTAISVILPYQHPDKTKSSLSTTKQDVRKLWVSPLSVCYLPFSLADEAFDLVQCTVAGEALYPEDLHEVCDDYLAKEERESDVVDDTYVCGNRNRLSFLERAKSTQKHLERGQEQLDRMEAKHDWMVTKHIQTVAELQGKLCFVYCHPAEIFRCLLEGSLL
jgi:hypothetical protein